MSLDGLIADVDDSISHVDWIPLHRVDDPDEPAGSLYLNMQHRRNISTAIRSEGNGDETIEYETVLEKYHTFNKTHSVKATHCVVCDEPNGKSRPFQFHRRSAVSTAVAELQRSVRAVACTRQLYRRGRSGPVERRASGRGSVDPMSDVRVTR